IEGRSVAIDVHTLDNYQGSIRSDEATFIKSSGISNNHHGLISSMEDVAIVDNAAHKSLLVQNTDGIVVAGERLFVDAESLINTGELSSVKDVGLTLSGNLINGGKLQTLEHLDVSARNAENNVNGDIAASS